MKRVTTLISLILLPMLCSAQLSGEDKEMLELITVSKEDLSEYTLINKEPNNLLYNDPIKERGISIYYADHNDDGELERNLVQLIYKYEDHDLSRFLDFFNDKFKKSPGEQVWTFIPDHEDHFYKIELVTDSKAFYILLQKNDFI